MIKYVYTTIVLVGAVLTVGGGGFWTDSIDLNQAADVTGRVVHSACDFLIGLNNPLLAIGIVLAVAFVVYKLLTFAFWIAVILILFKLVAITSPIL